MLGVEHDLEVTALSEGRLQSELRELSQERNDILDQLNSLTRQKNSLSEELVKLHREVDRHCDHMVDMSSDKEQLMKDKAEMSVRLTAAEQHYAQLAQVSFTCCR